MNLKTSKGVISTAALFAILSTFTYAAPITISEPGFEADGNWKTPKTGASIKGLFLNDALKNYTKAQLIDTPPDSGSKIAYNNGPDQNIYQVLDASLASKTTYRLRILAIDPTFANPFPGGELRLGYVSESPTPNDDFGLNLLKPTTIEKPIPFNDHENDPENTTDGIATWTLTFTTGELPAGLDQKLRIEILGGGKTQSIFDNIRLDARAATTQEIEAATKLLQTPKDKPILVMFGDSTTEGGMTQAVQKELNQLISSEQQPPKIINAGRGGDYAVAALKRLEEDVLTHKPDIVTISFGLNDTGLRKPDDYQESLEKMIQTLKEAQIQILLLTSTPFNNKQHSWAEKFEEIGGLDEYLNKEYCERIRSLAEKNDIFLCDLHAIFKAEINKDPDRINKLISGDGVHLTAEGYKLIAQHLAPSIIKRLAKE